jgi:hypothetical protein
VIEICKLSKALQERHGGMLLTEFPNPVRTFARVDTAAAYAAARDAAVAAVPQVRELCAA